MAQWFVTANEIVQGPYGTEELKKLIQSGLFNDTHLIWGGPMREWKPTKRWLEELPRILETSTDTNDHRAWHYSYEGNSFGPMNRNTLLQALKPIKKTSDVMVWTKGMKEWAPLYEFHDLMDDVGVNRRQYPRARIEGKILVKWDDRSCTGNFLTVSEGGCGGTGFADLVPGMTVNLTLQSQHFFDGIQLKAEVRYVEDTGFVGFRFQKTSVEIRSKIVQYVKSHATLDTETTAVTKIAS